MMDGGGDLNLRPSGYEPAKGAFPCSRLLPCNAGDEVVRETFVTSSPVYSRAVPDNTAPFTAPLAMQDDKPRCVTKREAREGNARARASARGVVNHFDFFSVLDVEGVAQRPVEVRARLDVEVADCVGVE